MYCVYVNACILCAYLCMYDVIESERASERSEHTVVLSLRFYYIYIYSVTKILRKIRATTFTENYGKLLVRGMSA